MQQTIITAAIAKTLDYARNRRACVLIQGRTGRGKTQACLAWCRASRHAYYIDCPCDGGLPALSAAIAAACGAQTPADIPPALSSRKATIVLDECARLIPTRGQRPKALEWLRRIHDTTGAALAFVATDFFMHEAASGSLGECLEQLIGRFRDRLVIPDYVSEQEAADILASVTPEPPSEDMIAWASKVANERGKGGARRLWWLCEDAADICRRTGSRLDLAFLRALLHDYEGRDRLPAQPDGK